MNHKPQTTPKIAVNAVVFNEKQEVLLAKRTDNGLWCIPGGHVDLGETLAQACLRELKEETGLEAQIVRLIGVYSDTKGSLHFAQGAEWHTVRVSFLCRVTGGALTTSEETSEIQYFNVGRLPPLITDHAKRIKDALEDKPQAVIA
ncbi:MAG TPA: NUDIX domain-containing protein [bacterium]|jgi:ADP-ribose pyrophosphatase YjhB (NUDIX family)|nr:NUDIX domain-containing protein [bacterium]